MNSSKSFEITPVGVLRTPYATTGQAPIQGVFALSGESVLEVFEQYGQGLDDIEGFSHLIVIYLLDRAGPITMQPVPLLDDQPHGVFATRNPRRPNRLALGVVRLLRRDATLCTWVTSMPLTAARSSTSSPTSRSSTVCRTRRRAGSLAARIDRNLQPRSDRRCNRAVCR